MLLPPARALSLALLARSCAAEWVQDRFAISFWVDPQVPEQDVDARFAEIAGANFTAHLGFNSGPNPYPPNPARVAAQLAAAAKHNLKSIPSICENCASPESCGVPYHSGGTCRDLKSEALWGYQLADEPSATLFPALRNWTQSIAAANPDALRFINLLPACAGEKFSGVKRLPMTYDEYVGNFTLVVRPQVLSMDSYPIFGQAEASIDQRIYRSNLATMRRHSLAAGIGFWSFFNCVPYSNHFDPTPAQLRWQALTALAYGAKGVLWYYYWSPYFAGTAGGGIILPTLNTTDPLLSARSYRPRPHYGHARTLNSLLKIYGGFLLNATSTGVYYVPDTSNVTATVQALQGCTVLAGIRSVALVNAKGKYLVGEFVLPEGEKAMLLQNQDDEHVLWSTVVFHPAAPQPHVQEVDPIHGGLRPLVDDSPWMDGISSGSNLAARACSFCRSWSTR